MGQRGDSELLQPPPGCPMAWVQSGLFGPVSGGLSGGPGSLGRALCSEQVCGYW